MQTGHAIITGGSSGIGLSLARLLVRQGWDLSLVARDPARLQHARDTLINEENISKQTISVYPADVTDRDMVEKIIHQCVNDNGVPRMLVTSAGNVIPGYFSELSLDDFEQLNRVNYLGTVYAVKSVMPYMLSAKYGHVVMISSGAGLTGIFGYTAYAPTKFAVRGFAESLRAEVKKNGIKVSVVFPPDTETPQLMEEEKRKPAETRYITGTGGTMTADAVAQNILAGVNRGKFSITPGLTMTLLYRLHSLAAPLLNYYFDSLAAKAGKEQVNRKTSE